MKYIKVNSFDEIPKNYTGIVEYTGGIKKWCMNGKIHREDGPAIEWSDGVKWWYLNDKHYTKEEYDIEMSRPNALRLV